MPLRTLAVPALALALTSPIYLYSAPIYAADQTDAKASTPAAKPGPAARAMLNFSQAGNSAMRAIRTARFDIFNGEPKIAVEQMKSARKFLGQAEKEAPVFGTTSEMLVEGKEVRTTSQTEAVKNVPFDGQLILADNFVVTPERKAHIDKANEHFKKGEHAKAIDELRLGNIDVTYMRSWMPIVESEKHLDQAIRLAGEGKYYEANLALKAIEDGVTVDSVTLSELLPKAAS